MLKVIRKTVEQHIPHLNLQHTEPNINTVSVSVSDIRVRQFTITFGANGLCILINNVQHRQKWDLSV